jgi:hypothetical protein
VELTLKCLQFLKIFKKDIEERTRGQGNTVLWQTARHIRITASSFHDVFVRKSDEKSCDNLVSKLYNVDSDDNTCNKMGKRT